MTDAYLPSGWPAAVAAPGSPDWTDSAVTWLLDEHVPYLRGHAASRYPVVLTFIARHVLKGAVEGARDGYRTTRSELGELVPPHAIDAVLRDCRTEGRRNWKDGFAHSSEVLKTKGKERASAFLAVALAIAFFLLNMYFAVADKTVVHPSVDWVQVAVFILTAVFLPQARYAFTGIKLPTVTGIAQSSWRAGYRFGSKVRPSSKS